MVADSPGFEINDAGRLGRADDLSAWGNLSYRETEPGDVLRNWQLGVWTSPAWNFDGVNRRKNVGMWGNATWNNFWRVFVDFGRDFTTQSDNQTRGGPLMTNPSETWGALTLHNNSASTTRWEVRGTASTDELGGWAYSFRTSFFTQPNDRLTLSVAPRYRRSTDARQYIDTEDGGSEATFGSRYIFGKVERSEIAASVRVNYSFTPDLNVELYAEPFASSGSYSRIGELARARSFDLREYGVEEGTGLERDEEGNYSFSDSDASFEIDNPDFDVLSFRSNLVLRWEWRPGSTLFLVWQQNRSADDDRGEFVNPGNLFDTLTADGENLLAIKFSYWLPL
jgi:hypothetical protein